MRTNRPICLAMLVFLSGIPGLGAATPEEDAFSFGQFIGAATFCKVDKARVDELAAALLASAGIDPKVPGGAMVKYDEGIAQGTQLMSMPGPATCDDVAAAFEEAYKRSKEQ